MSSKGDYKTGFKPFIRIDNEYLLDKGWEEVIFSVKDYPPPQEPYKNGIHQCKEGDKGWKLGDGRYFRLISDYYVKTHIRYQHVLDEIVTSIDDKVMEKSMLQKEKEGN